MEHDLKALERELRTIVTSGSDLIELIFKRGYTTPREFTLVHGAAEGIAAQMRTLVKVSQEIIAAATR